MRGKTEIIWLYLNVGMILPFWSATSRWSQMMDLQRIMFILFIIIQMALGVKQLAKWVWIGVAVHGGRSAWIGCNWFMPLKSPDWSSKVSSSNSFSFSPILSSFFRILLAACNFPRSDWQLCREEGEQKWRGREIALARESKTCRAVALLSTSHCGFANPPSKLLCTIKSWNWSCLTSARLRIGLLWPSRVPLRLTKRVDTDPIDAYLVSPQPTSHQQQLHKTKT